MKLFAEKGYDATSIEEITSVVGVAKGTLYYHFSSKEEIFNFLIDEGMKLLKNSIEIKTAKLDNSIDKLKAVILIQIKVIMKYENIITILLSQIWGTEPRNIMCRKYVFEYIKTEIFKDEKIKSQELCISDDRKVLALCDLSSDTKVMEIKTRPIRLDDNMNVGTFLARQLFYESKGRDVYLLSVDIQRHMNNKGEFITDSVGVIIYNVSLIIME